MNKSELRKKYKLLRNELTEELIDTYSIDIANQLLKLPIWEKSFFHLFLSIQEKKEIDTSFILNILQGKDKEILISKSDFNSRLMKNYLLTENTLIKKNKYNIPEPVDGIEVPVDKIEVVFIPLLAYDKKGNRVGYGKGFYDTFLASCNTNTLKIGLSFFEAEEQIEGARANDIPLDYCITPKNIYHFTI
ncbi:5-formyltetrahydrofolate cyclo-ligase [Flavobacteriaceae bacterium R38]|nr:5-formyltetrahydrofolate cyclo-ligase [Flavobacteriaceae bacterium R38]